MDRRILFGAVCGVYVGGVKMEFILAGVACVLFVGCVGYVFYMVAQEQGEEYYDD